jgi:hypothetical protein
MAHQGIFVEHAKLIDFVSIVENRNANRRWIFWQYETA